MGGGGSILAKILKYAVKEPHGVLLLRSVGTRSLTLNGIVPLLLPTPALHTLQMAQSYL